MYSVMENIQFIWSRDVMFNMFFALSSIVAYFQHQHLVLAEALFSNIFLLSVNDKDYFCFRQIEWLRQAIVKMKKDALASEENHKRVATLSHYVPPIPGIKLPLLNNPEWQLLLALKTTALYANEHPLTLVSVSLTVTYA